MFPELAEFLAAVADVLRAVAAGGPGGQAAAERALARMDNAQRALFPHGMPPPP